MTQLRQLELMKRTVWMNIQRIDKPSPERQRDVKADKDLTIAMYMLAYLGAIDMALIDLKEQMQEAKLYKQSLKYNFNRVERVVSTANGYANAILQAVNNGVRVKQYADMYEYAFNATQDSILIEHPANRSYSIVKALSRLFIEAYNKVGVRTNHRYLGDVAKVLPLIDIPQLKDHNVDCIIRNAVHITLAKQYEQ